ncbi:hypothetical protein, partial [Amphibiibacter pelophylacis]
KRYVAAAILPGAPKSPPHDLGRVSAWAIAQALRFSIDLTGKTVALDHDGVRHILNRHGSDKEWSRQQVPVTAEDMADFLEIFNTADLRVGQPHKAKDGAAMLAGSCVAGCWIYGFAAKVRRERIVAHTLFKRLKLEPQ